MEMKIGVRRLLMNRVIEQLEQKTEHLNKTHPYPIYVDDVVVGDFQGVRFRYGGNHWIEVLASRRSNERSCFGLSFRSMVNGRVTVRDTGFELSYDQGLVSEFAGYISQTILQHLFGQDAAKNIPHSLDEAHA